MLNDASEKVHVKIEFDILTIGRDVILSSPQYSDFLIAMQREDGHESIEERDYNGLVDLLRQAFNVYSGLRGLNASNLLISMPNKEEFGRQQVRLKAAYLREKTI
ncbi:MAG: hypothetical protein PHX61_05660 [Alphaproteobacteria bacterium]|nr:hypothetical protein [Alphaproteobacteria bacterium]